MIARALTFLDHIPAAVRGVVSAIAAEDQRALVYRLTLLVTANHGVDSGPSEVVIRVCCALGLVVPRLLRAPALWWAICIAMGAFILRNWHSVDNHRYLMFYWTIACATAINNEGALEEWRRSARLLVAVVFSFATIWKAVTGEFWDGSALQWLLVADARFEGLAAVLAASSREHLEGFRLAVQTLGQIGVEGESIVVPATERFRSVLGVMGWLTLAVEGGIACLFWWDHPRFYRLRQWVLVLFIASTYFVFPVTGFGLILSVLGCASTKGEDWQSRLLFLGGFALVHLTAVPWTVVLGS